MKLLATTLLISCLLLTDANNLRASRVLQTAVTQSFDVNLIVALHFVDDSTATALETKERANAAVEHFCNKVQEQVSPTYFEVFMLFLFPVVQPPPDKVCNPFFSRNDRLPDNR
jgi:hypothetical protein